MLNYVLRSLVMMASLLCFSCAWGEKSINTVSSAVSEADSLFAATLTKSPDQIKEEQKSLRTQIEANHQASGSSNDDGFEADLLGLPPPSGINVPTPIAGNRGKYMCPFTASGSVAFWAQRQAPGQSGQSGMAANVGGAVGQQVGLRALSFLPFGLGGIVGKQIGQSVGASNSGEQEIPGLDKVNASSDMSFNTVEDLAVYMYAMHSGDSEYSRILNLTRRVYPELSKAYVPAIEKAVK